MWPYIGIQSRSADSGKSYQVVLPISAINKIPRVTFALLWSVGDKRVPLVEIAVVLFHNRQELGSRNMFRINSRWSKNAGQRRDEILEVVRPVRTWDSDQFWGRHVGPG